MQDWISSLSWIQIILLLLLFGAVIDSLKSNGVGGFLRKGLVYGGTIFMLPFTLPFFVFFYFYNQLDSYGASEFFNSLFSPLSFLEFLPVELVAIFLYGILLGASYLIIIWFCDKIGLK